jgi:hypothetical protein
MQELLSSALKKLAADDGAQSHASGGRVHAWRTMRVRGVENPQGFGMINADLMLRFLRNNKPKP